MNFRKIWLIARREYMYNFRRRSYLFTAFVLPIITVGLFVLQQKMFMPPAADEQAAMQQKMMKYMMIFMGLMFFKVASGLCIYFIASSLWGLGERRFLPKTAPLTDTNVETRAEAKARAREAAAREEAAQAKKNRTKK